MASYKRSMLHVEGTDDVHAIGHLLRRHGIQCFIKGLQGNAVAPNASEISPKGGKDDMVDAITAEVKASSGRSVGFVLDADDERQSRWSAVRNRLQEVGMNPPETMPDNGYVDDLEKYKARVGVWLMPGHQREGALEQFLEDLVPEGDSLIKLAKSSTQEARTKGATFPDTKHAKAVLHTWLAWQKDPGLPYGSAIKAQFFRHDSPAAQAFIAWYKRLFADQS